MKATGLLSADQLELVFINLDELISANAHFTDKLQVAMAAAAVHGNTTLVYRDR